MKHKPIEIFARIASFVLRLMAPPKCAICGTLIDDSGELCHECLEYFAHAMNRRCPVCSKTARSCVCRPRNMFDTTSLGEKKLLALTYFAKNDCTDPGDIASRRLVYAVKKSPARSCVRFAARQISQELLKFFAKEKLDITSWCITYPPRSPKEARRFGFDQSKQLASLIAEYTGMKCISCFGRKCGKMQKNLTAAERKLNADEAYFLFSEESITDRKFIIVDDVVTTGSTVNACALLLKNSGATDIFPVCISRTKKKKRKPKRNSRGKLWFRR